MKYLLLTMLFLSSTSIRLNGQNQIQLNTHDSSIKWRGTMLFNFGEHFGTVNFKEGSLVTVNDKITTGIFIVDMNTIVNTDGDFSENLVSHLKNEDFFDVEKHETATLLITNVEYLEKNRINVTCNLTIKGITKPISFIAFLSNDRSQMTTKFIIDRSDWKIEYGSRGKVEIKDYAISDAIEFDVVLKF